MSDINNGGPAFPNPEMSEENFGNRSAYPGLTVRDYFIAHAPVEPQQWFEPELPPRAIQLPHFTKMHPDYTDSELAALHGFGRDYMEYEDVTEERVRNYFFQREEERKRNHAYSKMAERERYIQWPAAWADAMLEQRSK